MRPALEYASSIWSPVASSTSLNKLQVMQNAALRTATTYPQARPTRTTDLATGFTKLALSWGSKPNIVKGECVDTSHL